MLSRCMRMWSHITHGGFRLGYLKCVIYINHYYIHCLTSFLKVQDVSNKVLCSHSHTDALSFAVKASFMPTAESASPAHLLAAELASTFRSTLPDLHISSMCHGAHRVQRSSSSVQLQHTPHPWDAKVLPPSPACLHAPNTVASSFSSSCLPLFKVSLSNGTCPRGSDLSTAVPMPFDDSVSAHTFMTKQIDFQKSACSEVFSSFPEGWSHGYCAHVNGYLCIPNAPRVLHIGLSASIHPHVSASLLVDGDVVSDMFDASIIEDGISLGSHSRETSNALLALSSGCHSISVVYEDKQVEGQQNCTDVR